MIGKTLFPMAGAALVGALLVVNARAPVGRQTVDQAPTPPASVVSVPPVAPTEQVSVAPAPPAAAGALITHQAWVDAVSSLPPPCIAQEAMPAPLRPVQTNKTNRSKE